MEIIHISKYKNIKVTILITLSISCFVFLLSLLILNLSTWISIFSSSVVFLVTIIIIGRKIIVRHIIDKHKNIQIEFLLRPKHKVHFANSDYEKIVFKVVNFGRYGTYEKAIILLKNDPNYHEKYYTFNMQDELKWFWTDFKYPNKKKSS